jgi:hypothetical protein
MTAQSIDFGFAPRARDGDLVALWRLARAAAENAPACPCHGIVAGRIDPDVIEGNMLATLRTRYREGGQSELVALIEARLRKSPFAGMTQSFESWLQGLAAAPLSAATRALLRDDLAAELKFYAEAQPQFECG